MTDAQTQGRLVRVARRSAGWMVLGAVFAGLSVRAYFDLHGLFVGLAVVLGLIGAAVAGFTWFDPQ